MVCFPMRISARTPVWLWDCPKKGVGGGGREDPAIEILDKDPLPQGPRWILVVIEPNGEVLNGSKGFALSNPGSNGKGHRQFAA